MKKKKLMS